MRKVKLNRTIVHEGKMYLRGSEVVLEEEQLNSLSGYYDFTDKPKRVDIRPRTTAIRQPVRTTNISELDINDRTQDLLKQSGIETVEQLRTSGIQKLVGIKGIGEKTAQQLLEKANES